MSPGLATLLLTEVGTEEEEEEGGGRIRPRVRRRRPPPSDHQSKVFGRGASAVTSRPTYCVCAERTTTADFKADENYPRAQLAISVSRLCPFFV